MAQAAQKYKPMHPLMRSRQKRDAKRMLAERPPAADPVAGAVAEVRKNLETVISTKKMTPEQRQAIAAGAARAWYADIPGAATDIAGLILDYGVEGFKSIMPGPELTGYNLEKDLRIDKLQKGLRDPFLGYKHLERVGEKAGYIPPTTGTDLEFNARLAAGFIDAVPIPMSAGVFASNRARTLPKLSKAKAEKMETARNDPQEIFEKTGFFKGPEGEWRFEISDKDMKINQEFLKTKTDLWGKAADTGPGYELDVGYAKLSDVVDHPELFKAYPELKEVYLKFEPPGAGRPERGYYQEFGEYVPVAPRSGPERLPEELLKDIDESGLFALERGANKTPEAYRKVIMVVAPTRQREIKRLNMIIEEATRNKENAFWKIEATKKDPEMRKQGAVIEGNYKLGSEDIIKAEELSIERSQEIIKENLPELQRLEAGGQPNLEFSIKSTITHEIQHAIQGIENLPRGGSPQTAFQDTREAALAPILEKATKGGKHPEFGLMTRLDQEKVLYSEKLRDMSMMDDVRYLQQLQKFILSDQPTRNARFIENSSFNYGLTIPEERALGPRPKKHRRQEYAEYLRRKAMLYQRKVVDKYLPGPTGKYSQKRDKFNSLLGDLINYTEGKGTATHPKEVGEQFLEAVTPGGLKRTADGSQFDPKKVRGDFHLVDENLIYDQPNWLALGEKNVKNYVNRLARKADKHREGAGLKRQIEAKLADLENMRKDFNDKGRGSDFEFYKRLAGEAEARAVQKRLDLADVEAGGWGKASPDDFDPTDPVWMEHGAGMLKEEGRKVPTDLYDVPIRELAFTGRTPAAKTQAKSDAQAILSQTDEPLHRTLKPETGSVWDESGYASQFLGEEGLKNAISIPPKSLLEKDFKLKSGEILLADKTAENITTKKRDVIGFTMLHKNTQPDEGPYRITHFYKQADPKFQEPKAHTNYPNLKEALQAFAYLSERHGGLKLIKPKAN